VPGDGDVAGQDGLLLEGGHEESIERGIADPRRGIANGGGLGSPWGKEFPLGNPALHPARVEETVGASPAMIRSRVRFGFGPTASLRSIGHTIGNDP
jgi:hypothetical protein